MRPVDYIALSIPVFFALIGVELLWARFRGEQLYRLNDSVNDLSTGILDQVLGAFTKAAVVGLYALVHERFRVGDWDPASPWTWILCFLGVDFFYYWFHRVSHESSLPWGAHIVHHQSEEFNLSVALRQGAFQHLFSAWFYLPLAWMGFPPLVFLTCSAFDTLYQFWIHTRAIDKLGPLEWVLNTPSHHRVHHGCDEKYLDKNYAGTLIVWDRLFGSFQAEEEAPTYGITKPLRSWNPAWANLHHFADLARKSRHAPNLLAALELWLRRPGWQPGWLPAEPPDPRPAPLTHGDRGKYDRRPPAGLFAYAIVQFLLVLAATVYFLFLGHQLEAPARVGLALLITWSVIDVGGLIDRRRWALPAELGRLAAVGIAAAAAAARSLGTTELAIAVGGLLAAGSGAAAWLLAYRHALDDGNAGEASVASAAAAASAAPDTEPGATP
jgi:alkylglycerol monooxygenase